MGVRRMHLSTRLLKQVLRHGTHEMRPRDPVPEDLEVVAARLLADPPDLLELMVSSASFDGPPVATWEAAPLWSVMFDRIYAGETSGAGIAMEVEE